MLVQVLVSTLANLVVLFGFPFVIYSVVQKWRWKRSFRESLERLGLRAAGDRATLSCVVLSMLLVGALVLWSPPVESLTRQGSAQRVFLGAGLSGGSILAALLYGVVQTGFSEEFLFRGLITGVLARRMSRWPANVLQATIFLLPHLAILFVMPEMWAVLPLVFLGALFTGWVRIESGSILGPWILHASANTTMALSIAIRSGA